MMKGIFGKRSDQESLDENIILKKEIKKKSQEWSIEKQAIDEKLTDMQVELKKMECRSLRLERTSKEQIKVIDSAIKVRGTVDELEIIHEEIGRDFENLDGHSIPNLEFTNSPRISRDLSMKAVQKKSIDYNVRHSNPNLNIN